MSQRKEEEQEGLITSSSEHIRRSRTSFIFQPLLYHYQISLKYVFLGFDIFQQIISTHCPGDLSWESKSGREWPRVLRSANQAFTSSTSPSWNGKNMEMSRSSCLWFWPLLWTFKRQTRHFYVLVSSRFRLYTFRTSREFEPYHLPIAMFIEVNCQLRHLIWFIHSLVFGTPCHFQCSGLEQFWSWFCLQQNTLHYITHRVH